MCYWVYVLKSASTNRYYCGSTDNIERRVRQHNDSNYRGSKTTKRFEGPWELIWQEKSKTRGVAMRREKVIKKRGIGRFLSNLDR